MQFQRTTRTVKRVIVNGQVQETVTVLEETSDSPLADSPEIKQAEEAHQRASKALEKVNDAFKSVFAAFKDLF